MNRLSLLLYRDKEWALLPSQPKAGLSFLPTSRRPQTAVLFIVRLEEEARLQEQHLLYAIHRQGVNVGKRTYHHKPSGAQTTYAIHPIINPLPHAILHRKNTWPNKQGNNRCQANPF